MLKLEEQATIEAPAEQVRVTAQEHGKSIETNQAVAIHAAQYRTGTLSVSPKFVEPAPEAMKQIEEESQAGLPGESSHSVPGTDAAPDR